MSAATMESKTPPTNPNRPANWDDHQKEKSQRKEARDKRRKEMRKYLDPEMASRAEAKKPLYEWLVTASISRQNSKGRIETKDYEESVLAQTETTAWALFCDKIGVWPGPHDCEREIKQLGKV